MFYRLVNASDGAPYTGGTIGIYRGQATIAERVPDEEATARGLEDSAGFPVDGWIWWPTGNLNYEPSKR